MEYKEVARRVCKSLLFRATCPIDIRFGNLVPPALSLNTHTYGYERRHEVEPEVMIGLLHAEILQGQQEKAQKADWHWF
jgi:hypothetical protein